MYYVSGTILSTSMYSSAINQEGLLSVPLQVRKKGIEVVYTEEFRPESEPPFI